MPKHHRAEGDLGRGTASVSTHSVSGRIALIHAGSGQGGSTK